MPQLSPRPELLFLVRAIDLEYAQAMHDGRKLGENWRCILGQRFDPRYHATITNKRIVFIFLSTQTSEQRTGIRGAVSRAFCLAEMGPVLNHADIASPALQLGHYSRLVHPDYSPFLHLFKRSRGVLGLIPDEFLRPALYAMPAYGQTGDAPIDPRSPLHACLQKLVYEEGSWREHDLDPRLYHFCQRRAHQVDIINLPAYYPPDQAERIRFKEHVTAHRLASGFVPYQGKNGHLHSNVELMCVAPAATPKKGRQVICLYCSKFMANIYADHDHHRHVVPCPACHRTLFRVDIQTTPLALLLKTCLCYGNAEYAKLRGQVAEGETEISKLMTQVCDLKKELQIARERAKRKSTESAGPSEIVSAACTMAADAANKATIAGRTRSRK